MAETIKVYKGQGLWRRSNFALQGIRRAFSLERSFRTQSLAALFAGLACLILRPGWLWSGLIAVAIGLVLALELVNTALEHALDGLNPEYAEFIAVAKDCAAGAVLVSSILSLVLFAFMLADRLGY